jgi:CRISPR/Cas system-associated exonuclease Cas4 (RecB family)
MTNGELPKLRSSERNAFMRCPQKWWWGNVECLAPRAPKYATAAEFGTLIHIALAEYYLPGLKRGPHPADTFDDLAKDEIAKLKTQETVDEELVVKWVDFRQLGVDLMDGYVERYKGDPHWDVLDAERKFSVLIPDVRFKPLKSEKGRRGFKPIVNFVGVFDLCFRDLNDGQVKMVDHKTANQILLYHLTLDTQASGYIAVATHALRYQGLIGDKEVVKGMEYNFIRKGNQYKEPLKQAYIDALWAEGIQYGDGVSTPKDKPIEKLLKKDLAEMCQTYDIKVLGEPTDTPIFVRHFVPRTPAERQRSIVRISEEARVMADVREGRLPILKNTQRDCYFCQFFDLCEIDEAGGDTEYFKESTMIKVDPYADHDEKKLEHSEVGDGSAAQG